jgi:hypothetical protein
MSNKDTLIIYEEKELKVGEDSFIVTDRHRPSILKILWTQDLTKAFLSINNYYHAVFDFQNRAGYCRNGFPGNSSWAKVKERTLTDSLLVELAEGKTL